MLNNNFCQLKQTFQFNDNLICYGARQMDNQRKNIDNKYEIISPKQDFILQLTKRKYLKPSNLMFITMVFSKLSEKGITNFYDKPFIMSLKEYTEFRGISFNKARDKVKDDLDALFDMYISLDYYDKSNHIKTDFRLINEKSVINKSVIYFWFTPQFLSYYSNLKYIMPLSKEIFRFDLRYNPNSFTLAYKLHINTNINERKDNKNSDCLSVRTLLEYCPKIPTYDNKMKSQGGLNQRIIQPFVRDMNAINIIDWCFLDENNNIVDKNNIKSYVDFIDLKVKYTWKNGYEKEVLKKKRD